MYADNQLLFPHAVISQLRNMRGSEWAALVDRITAVGETHEDCLAFMLMMVRLNGCMVCETDSYRAMRGCSACAVQTLRRYKGTDEELLSTYQQARADVQRYLAKSGRSTVAVGAA